MKYTRNSWNKKEDFSWILCNTEDEIFQFNNYLEALEGRRLQMVDIDQCSTFSKDHCTTGYRFVLSSALPTEIVKTFFNLMED